MSIGEDPTLPATPAAKRNGSADAGGGANYTIDEVVRALGHVESKVDRCTAILTGDPTKPRDLGLRGDVQRLLGTGRWVQVALALAALAVGFRAISSEGRERGWWGADAEHAEATQ